MTRNEIETAKRPALISFLKAKDCYKGLSKARVSELREAALAYLRRNGLDTQPEAEPEQNESGWPVETPVPADAAPEPEGVEYPKAKLVDVVPAKPETKPAKVKLTAAQRADRDYAKLAAKRAERLEAAIKSAGGLTLTASDLIGAGYNAVVTTKAACWVSPRFRAFRGAAESGYLASVNPTDDGSFTVTLTAATEDDIKFALPAVKPATVGKLATLTRNAVAAEDGSITLTAEDMVMTGLPKSWASVPNSDLRDPLTMAARCWAAVGFTALVEGGDVVLTPVASQAEEAAA